jgi:hypothetical protein
MDDAGPRDIVVPEEALTELYEGDERMGEYGRRSTLSRYFVLICYNSR